MCKKGLARIFQFCRYFLQNPGCHLYEKANIRCITALYHVDVLELYGYWRYLQGGRMVWYYRSSSGDRIDHLADRPDGT